MDSAAPIRILVAIANYGDANQQHLETLLAEYRQMPYEVDIVVLSDRPKALGADIEVLVGLPTADPRSLPFAHRSLFAQRDEDYDLYIYSEDDTLIRQSNIDAFIETTRILPTDKIAGFVRYEVAPDGTRSYSSVHTVYGWRPDSVFAIGSEEFAELDNPHSASFILTRQQLRCAIESGGFLVKPHTGREDMMVAAATDPYVQCGLTRVIPITRIDDFALHHLPNKYVGHLGTHESDFDLQLKVLRRSSTDRRRLFETHADVNTVAWYKSLQEVPQRALDRLVSPGIRVLAVGCGAGAPYREAVSRGTVTGIPIDAVVGAVAESRGLTVLPPDLDGAFNILEGEEFDLIVLLNVMQYLPEPSEVVNRLRPLLARDGEILVIVPNMLRSKVHSLMRRNQYFRPPEKRFEDIGIHRTSYATVRRWLADGEVGRVRFHASHGGAVGRVRALLSESIAVRGRVRRESRHRRRGSMVRASH